MLSGHGSNSDIALRDLYNTSAMKCYAFKLCIVLFVT